MEQLAFGEVKSEDKAELAKLVSAIKSNYTDKFEESRKHWGGGIRGTKSVAKLQARAKALGQVRCLLLFLLLSTSITDISFCFRRVNRTPPRSRSPSELVSSSHEEWDTPTRGVKFRRSMMELVGIGRSTFVFCLYCYFSHCTNSTSLSSPSLRRRLDGFAPLLTSLDASEE